MLGNDVFGLEDRPQY